MRLGLYEKTRDNEIDRGVFDGWFSEGAEAGIKGSLEIRPSDGLGKDRDGGGNTAQWSELTGLNPRLDIDPKVVEEPFSKSEHEDVRQSRKLERGPHQQDEPGAMTPHQLVLFADDLVEFRADVGGARDAECGFENGPLTFPIQDFAEKRDCGTWGWGWDGDFEILKPFRVLCGVVTDNEVEESLFPFHIQVDGPG